MASPRVVLAGATAAQAAVSLVSFGFPAIGPELQGEFALSLAELGAVLTANLLGSGITLFAAGVAVDRYGARAAMGLGTAVAVICLVAAAFAPSVKVLIALLFLSGIGSAAVPIAGMGAVFHAYEPDRRGWALGVRQMAVPLAGTIGSIALPGLAALGGVRLALLFSAGAVGVLCSAFALVSAGGPAGGPRPRPELARILREPGMRRLLLVAAFYIVVLQAVLTYTVPAAREAGLSAFAAGATFFVVNVTAGVARIIWGRIADRDGGRRRVRALVEVGWVAAGGGVLFALALHAGVAAVLPAAIVFAFGALGWNALVYLRAGETAPPGLAAQSVAVAATLVFMVSAVSTPPMGALAEHAGWDVFWLVAALVAAAGAVVAGTLRPSRRRPAPATT